MEDVNSHLNVFKDLEKDLKQAIQLDKTYQLRNDAKFRAVSQNSESYEEFKEIVDAAHLQPIRKIDKQAMRMYKPVIWNPLVNSQSVTTLGTGTTKPGINDEFELHLYPQTYQEFIKSWKSNFSAREKFKILRNVCVDWLARFLEREMSSCSLGHLLKVLLQFENNRSDFEYVVQILTDISKMSRFQLTLDFLSDEETNDCKTVFLLLRDQLEQSPDSENEASLKELENKYKLQ